RSYATRRLPTSSTLFPYTTLFRSELFAKLMPVGFYYKAFHKPRWLFNIAESAMRKVAGLGRINPEGKAGTSPKDYTFCDLLVIRSEEHTSELQSRENLVCRLLLEK